MGEDLDDTVIVPARPAPAALDATPEDTEDTVITAGRPRATRPVPGLAITEPVASGPGTYSLRIGLGGDPIPLDVPCLVGRRPSAPRITRGAAPRLVEVASPAREVSATHLEVRQLGSSVIVTDLKSTNGSIVMVPGRVPRTLRQGESVVVSPGTLVDIGDDNILQILPTQRLGHAPTGRQP